ncbi:MAG: AAA family ATPase [Prevotella sp.]|nr:AAA family ATPase [Prevotella sp.]
MIGQELEHLLHQHFPFAPTGEQRQAFVVFAQFLCEEQPSVLILKGAAGTGKTEVASAFVRTLVALQQKILLLAPTGRAAKVFSLSSGYPAYTIHRRIYRGQMDSPSRGSFQLNYAKMRDAVVLVDEASMVSNNGDFDALFGSGRLLDDLVQYVFGGENCKLVLIGDWAQLPPVGEIQSPALSKQVMEGYGLKVYETRLSQVLRQQAQSGILFNATMVRAMLERDDDTLLPKVRFQGFADIVRVPGDELIESLYTSYAEVGADETIVVTRSNKRAGIYNNGIRGRVLGREEELSSGDMLMVVRNNYFWAEKEKINLEFIANGDRAKVVRVRNMREFYGFHFADVTMQMPDYDDVELTCTVLLDTLQTEAPALTHEQHETLFNGVMEDYADLPTKADRMDRMRKDIYYNALQVKYAYAVTCHKAQGGQWAHVYVDQGYMTDDMLTPDYFHWLYTAFTRATEKLFLVNWPEKQIERP